LGDDSFLQLKVMTRQLKEETQTRRNIHVGLLTLLTHHTIIIYLHYFF